MVNIIVAFSVQKDAVNIRNLLVRHGHHVLSVCVNQTQIMQVLDRVEGTDGIIVTGYKHQDGTYRELLRHIPDTWQLVLMASPGILERVYEDRVTKIPMPVKTYDLFLALEDLEEQVLRSRKKRRSKPKVRSEEDQKLLSRAKAILQEKKGFSEIEAHKYIQKCSMNNGTNLLEMAQMIIDLYDK